MAEDAQSQANRDLLKSVREESAAIEAYTPRKAFAELHGMQNVGQLYGHVIGEERQHQEEFINMAAAPKPLMCREPSELRESRCESVLQHPPECNDFFNTRRFVMCSAWQKMRERGGKKLPISEAWREVRGVCVKP
jgi:hypothetical protein